MKRLPLLLLILSLTGCAAPEAPPPAVEVMAPAPVEERFYLGLAVTASLSQSMHATEAFPGYARTEMTAAAVVVDGGGVIRACTVDGISARVPFDTAGTLLLFDGTVFPSKRTLGDAYGMHKASKLGAEWYRQADAVAAHCVGKTADELRPADAVTSVTISTDELLQTVRRAAQQATLPAAAPDAPVLVCRAVMTGSRSAHADTGQTGLAGLRGVFLACADGAEAGCALSSAVPFTAAGRIDCDISLGLSPLSDALTLTDLTDHECQLLRQAAGKS